MVEEIQIGAIGPKTVGEVAKAAGPVSGAGFREILEKSIGEVNRLQAEADAAVARLTDARSGGVSEVFGAVRKAEFAFNLLMQIRNKLEQAYDEIRQMRV